MRPELNRRISVAKDLILFVVGLGGIVYQLVTAQVSVPLLVVFTSMTGVPALTNLLSFFKTGLDTGSQSSVPVPPVSDSESQR
jgi:hypothetical protein